MTDERKIPADGGLEWVGTAAPVAAWSRIVGSLAAIPISLLEPEDRVDCPCRADPELWFTRVTEPDAKQICGACPALDACRRAIDTLEADGHLEYGVWAAETPTERRQRRNQATKPRKRRGRATLARTPAACRYCARPFRRWSETAADRPGTVKHHGHGMCESCAGRLRRGNRKELT